MTPPMGRTMIRAAIIQHTPEIRKNMALADSMVVTAAFMKWPFDCIFSFDQNRVAPRAAAARPSIASEASR